MDKLQEEALRWARGLAGAMRRPLSRDMPWPLNSGQGSARAARDGAVIPEVRSMRALDNPANLDAFAYVPSTVKRAPGLIVTLHGCAQDAVGFARAAGWFGVADRAGAVLVMPKQSLANNRNGCFSWFRPDDVARGRGEARSIRSIVATAAATYGADPRRVFIVGLSAGGAMAGAMLVAYPELFAAGAIVGGLPTGESTNAAEAMRHMLHAGHADSDAAWARMARDGDTPSRWPRVSIWHGTADRVVDAGNADNLVSQWRGLMDLPHGADRTETQDGATRRVWLRGREPMLEQWSIQGMGHGYPTFTGAGDRWVVRAPVDATREIGRFFGLSA